MSNVHFGYENRFLAGTLLVTSESAALPAENLRSPEGSPARAWQTEDGVLSATLHLDAGASVTWRDFALAGTNLTPDATVRIRLGPTQFTLNQHDSGLLPGPVRGYRQVVHIAPTERTARWLRIDISDPGNPDGNLNIPLAFAGPVWQPDINISPSSAYSPTGRTTERETQNGGLLVRPEFYRRGYVLAHDATTEAEQWLQVEEMARVAWTGQNILVIPTPDSEHMQREALFGRLQTNSDFTFPYGAADLRAWRARIDERL
ncbi:hypothetical protein [Roseomonas sp. USHLN139]|uniref:hypothetical protein n=1 Tax=Roseomonas sp. USHLN139 TaxID=3081298 RepID=UPI003B02A5B8